MQEENLATVFRRNKRVGDSINKHKFDSYNSIYDKCPNINNYTTQGLKANKNSSIFKVNSDMVLGGTTNTTNTTGFNPFDTSTQFTPFLGMKSQSFNIFNQIINQFIPNKSVTNKSTLRKSSNSMKTKDFTFAEKMAVKFELYLEIADEFGLELTSSCVSSKFNIKMTKDKFILAMKSNKYPNVLNLMKEAKLKDCDNLYITFNYSAACFLCGKYEEALNV